MNTSTIEPELNSLLSKLTAEIAADAREIEVRQKRIKKNETLLRAVRGSLGVANPSNSDGYGKQAETVRAAIRRIAKPQFTQKDIEDEIGSFSPEIAISTERIKSVLWSLQRKKEMIKQVKQGNNRGQVAVFEKLPAAGNPNSELNPPRAIPSRIPLPRRTILSE